MTSQDGSPPTDASPDVAPDPVDGDRIVGLVVARGAATALIFAMPAAFLNVVLASQVPKPQVGINLSFLVVLIGFAIGGALAGREAPAQAAKHGAFAALAAYVPVEIVGLLGRSDRGDPVSLPQIIILGLLAACAGTIGARFGANRRRRKEPT